MSCTLQEINSQILAEGNKLASVIKDDIINITLHCSGSTNVMTSKDVPSRPWMLTGSALVAAGVIGTMSTDSKWPYVIGALGLVLLGVGFSKRNLNSSSVNGRNDFKVNLDDEKAFIIEKCNKIIDSKKAEWDNFMDGIKAEIQTLIKKSSVNEEKKEEFLSLTYYPETLSLSALPLIDKFDSIENNYDGINRIMSVKSDFANVLAVNIIQTANRQVQIFNNIIV